MAGPHDYGAAANPLATSTHSAPPAVPPDTAIYETPRIAGRSKRTWPPALTPSFADCFFMALLVWLFVCGANGWKALLMDGDTGWHIRTGEYILAHHAVPHHDLFSFSKPGAPWFAWEWLYGRAFTRLLFRMGGLKAIVLFAGVLIAVYATVLLRYAIWRGANALVAAVTTLLAVGGASMHFLARPHLFTLLLLPVCIWLVEADRRKNTRWVWLLVPVTALWTNLHGGFFMFLACSRCWWPGTSVEAAFGKAPRWPAVCGRYAACCCWVARGVVRQSLRHGAARSHLRVSARRIGSENLVQEFQAPTFRSEGQLQYEALLLAGLMLVGFLLERSASPKRSGYCSWRMPRSSACGMRPSMRPWRRPLIACGTQRLVESRSGAHSRNRRRAGFCISWERICAQLPSDELWPARWSSGVGG